MLALSVLIGDNLGLGQKCSHLHTHVRADSTANCTVLRERLRRLVRQSSLSHTKPHHGVHFAALSRLPPRVTTPLASGWQRGQARAAQSGHLSLESLDKTKGQDRMRHRPSEIGTQATVRSAKQA